MSKRKPGPKLMNGQRAQLLTWMAADYEIKLILKWAAEQDGWPVVDRHVVQYYRRSKKWGPEIARLRRERYENAVNTGLALREERIARLCKHADELEAIKWLPDDKGRFWNEKAWRETLDDIAREMGERKTTIDVHVVREEARKLADKLGLDPAAILAEAEKIVARQG